MTIQKFSLILILIVSNMICGCISVRIKDPSLGVTLGNPDNWNDKPITVFVEDWRIKVPPLFVPWYIAVDSQGDRHYFEPYKGTPFIGDTVHVDGVPMETVQIPYYISRDIVYTKNLCEAIERSGMKVVNENNQTSKPDYYLNGIYDYILPFRVSTVTWITWDILMDLPACFFPVPLGIPLEVPLELTIYSSDHNEIARQEILTDGRVIFFSVWGSSKGVDAIPNAIADTAANIAKEMIHDHQQNK